MPRYVVERTFPEGLPLTADAQGAAACSNMIASNTAHGVTWVHSYIGADKKRTFCIYDAPSPDAARRASEATGLPVDNVTEVKVLDPYFYQ